MSPGAVKVGAVLSATVIVCVWVVELPEQSTSFHVLVIVYEPAHAPATGVASVYVAWIAVLSQLSASSVRTRVAVVDSVDLHGASVMKVNAPGAVTVGGVLSATVIVVVWVVELAEQSTSFHVFVCV